MSWSFRLWGSGRMARGQGSYCQDLGQRRAPVCPGQPPAAWRARSPQPARHNSDKGLSAAAGGAREGSQRTASASSRQPQLPKGPGELGEHVSLGRPIQGGSNLGQCLLEVDAPQVVVGTQGSQIRTLSKFWACHPELLDSVGDKEG